VPAAAAEPIVTPTVVDPPHGGRPPGTYLVRPGDTLIRIGLDNGQNWRDIARWNNLENPNALEVGQVLRVVPPEPAPGAAVAQGVAPATKLDAKPLPPASAAPTPAATPTAVAASGKDSKEPDDDLGWQWPAAGPVLAGFDDARSKGVAIGGKAGDPVLAAADGRVVYAGSGLRGYGNLVIVKHNATFLSAYAHNQALLVKEDQVVRRGQKIAEMGASDADRVQLHFEIRRQGRPVDPTRYLPAR
jgi:lipoprotein NlpD